MGTPQAAVPTLERIVNDGHEVVAVYTQPDRPSGRGHKIDHLPVKQFALENQIEIFQPVKVRTAETLQTFRSHDADVVVVVAYGRILPATFLNAFPKGAINVHFSLLPKYRGAAPVNWAIANGETTTGVTTMKMDAGLDTGDILLQREVGIGPDETAPELMERLSLMGAELLSETLGGLNEIKPREQDEAAASYAPILKREDGLIDWNRSAKELSNRVRGFQPFPSSFTLYRDRRVTIWKATPCENTASNSSTAGTIISLRDKLITVSCGRETALAVIEVQPEGKKRMSAADFVNGSRVKIGDRFN
jgi:methionyl-tRNA formyltransferase